MVVAQPTEPLEALPGIRPDSRALEHVVLDEAAERVSREVVYRLDPDSARPVSAPFHGHNHDRGGAECISTAAPAGIGAAYVGVVDLDHSGERRPLRRNHGAP